MLKNYQYQSDFARKYYGQGKLEGKEEGRVEGLRETAIAIAHLRVTTLAAELEALIRAELDPERLRDLITSMVASADELATCAAISALGQPPRRK